MSIISKETWNKFTEEEKKNVKKEYLKWQEEAETNPYFEGKITNMEELFDKENLQPKPKNKTWEDLEKDGFSVEHDYLREFDDWEICIDAISYNCDISDKLIYKAIATLKIAKLIELGYGGLVTEEEWVDGNVEKVSIIYKSFKKKFDILYNSHRKEFITFHTRQQAEEFMSYPENVELVEQYYMI